MREIVIQIDDDGKSRLSVSDGLNLFMTSVILSQAITNVLKQIEAQAETQAEQPMVKVPKPRLIKTY